MTASRKCSSCGVIIQKEAIEHFFNLQKKINHMILTKKMEVQLYHQAMEMIHFLDESFLDFLNLAYAYYNGGDENSQNHRLNIANLILKNYQHNRSSLDPTTALLEMAVAKLYSNLNLLNDAEFHINNAKVSSKECIFFLYRLLLHSTYKVRYNPTIFLAYS